jgi:hypothetical protein
MPIELQATDVLDDEWSPTGSLDVADFGIAKVDDLRWSSDRGEGRRGYPQPADEWGSSPSGGSVFLTSDEIKDRLRAIRIEIADHATTTLLSSDATHDYLKTELGMNILVPEGKIEELRFQVQLAGDGVGDVYAIDGFPKDKIEARALVSGKVTVGVNTAFQLIAVAAGTAVGGPAGALLGQTAGKLGDLLKIDLNPWEFAVGDVRDVQIDFSEANTSNVEWFFRGGSLLNSLGVMLTIKKPRTVTAVAGTVTALWDYKAGWFRGKLGSGRKTLSVYAPAT